MNLKTRYIEQLKTELQRELGITNPMAVARVTKVVIDMGIGEASKNAGMLEQTSKDLGVITGQKAQVRRAKIAVSGFGLRKDDPVGLRVTLRGGRMYSFLEKLISVVFPRLRDFRGIKRSAFDGRGNYTFGLVEHTIFPEIDVIKSSRPLGMGITIVTTAKTDEEARALLAALGMPFEKG